ncbi:glycosyltransferase family 1 [Apiospora saccharicola]|uniref:Glycosyltransferase family 1 n=1 Tax=Apiospora saccharicola TaxID=335842 RepID=A0ABR1TME4_9PEZI
MAERMLTVTAVVAVLLAAVLVPIGLHFGSETEVTMDYLPGKNSTVLFVTNNQHGLSNVHLATAQSLVERHPHVQVHYASFSSWGARVARVSELARMQAPSAPEITFHEIQGQSYAEAVHARVVSRNPSTMWFRHAPGLNGYPELNQMLQDFVSPWEADAHLSLYEEVQEAIGRVDPAVVVLDGLLSPAIDATREANRRLVFVAPNSLHDHLAFEQPYGKGFWKYPCDIPFPVPWHRIPENIYLASRFIYSVYISPQWRASAALLKERGISAPTQVRDGKALYIAPHIPRGTLPLEVVRSDTLGTNSIVLESAPAAQQDSELANWLQNAPTLLINLGSAYRYSEESASIMAQAIQVVLAQTEVQVLWKLARDYEFGDEFKDPLGGYWLPIDAMAMMETGHIIASVHHGGANSYHEALAGGVPHVVVPMWVDLYNYATLAEFTGVGVYATRGTAPDWSVEGLSSAFLAVLTGPNSAGMRERARAVAERMRRDPGSHQAAKAIAELATHKSL